MGREWSFQGRQDELRQLQSILARKRFFFVRMTGRRRIGKTTLVHEAIRHSARNLVLYVQVPDSGPAGVLSCVRDFAATFEVPNAFSRPGSLRDLARFIRELIEAGYLVVLDEFQYFVRKPLRAFSSYLQAEIDVLTAKAAKVRGGLVVLGSLQAEMEALLQNRYAPLYNRTTDEIDVTHLDVPTLATMLRQHGSNDPNHLLFLWNLFEGVPKFYRDCFEQNVLVASRSAMLSALFFTSSAPLRTEADNWFLKELRGRYDTLLKYIARNPGREHADITAYTRDVDRDTFEAVGTYLKILQERFGLIEARQPFGSKPGARRRRYYLRDHFLQAWLDALAPAVTAGNFRPLATLIEQADRRLIVMEGKSLERMVHQLWERQSRLGNEEFTVTQAVGSWWGKTNELDMIALDEDKGRVSIATCKRSGEKILASLQTNEAHVEAFIQSSKMQKWKIERFAIAPGINKQQRKEIASAGYKAYGLVDLF